MKYDRATGLLTGSIHHWVHVPKGGIPESLHTLEATARDFAGNLIVHRWKVQVSPTYDRAMKAVGRLDVGRHGADELRKTLEAMEISDVSLKRMRALVRAIEIVQRCDKLQSRLAGAYASGLYLFFREAVIVTRGLEKKIEELEGKPREEIVGKQKAIREDVEAILGQLRSESADDVHGLFPGLPRQAFKWDRSETDDKWIGRLARILVNKYLDRAKPAWSRFVEAFGKGKEPVSIEKAEAALKEAASSGEKALAEWGRHYAKAKEEAAKENIASGMALIFRSNPTFRAATLLVQLWYKSKAVMEYKRAAEPAAKAYRRNLDDLPAVVRSLSGK